MFESRINSNTTALVSHWLWERVLTQLCATWSSLDDNSCHTGCFLKKKEDWVKRTKEWIWEQSQSFLNIVQKLTFQYLYFSVITTSYFCSLHQKQYNKWTQVPRGGNTMRHFRDFLQQRLWCKLTSAFFFFCLTRLIKTLSNFIMKNLCVFLKLTFFTCNYSLSGVLAFILSINEIFKGFPCIFCIWTLPSCIWIAEIVP